MKRYAVAVCYLCVLLLIITFYAQAQTTNATISGRITDPQGRVVAGVQVQAVNIETQVYYPSESNSDGIYLITTLPPGQYRMIVRKDGFHEINKTDILLHVQDLVEQNFSLQLGSVSESVTVTGNSTLVNTESPAVSTVVDHQFAENLPMNGRSFQTLIELTPGVVLNSNQGQFSVNGQRGASNYWMVDGVSANVGISFLGAPGNGLSGSVGAFSVLGGTNSNVSVDAMQEFRIQTSTYAPEFGRAPGAQISIVTRSGANQFHGTAFDYLRNDALDAADWFVNFSGLAKPAERQNDFGGTFSGPILKDRTFFFFSYEGLRLRLPEATESVVPDDPTTPGGINLRNNASAAIQPFLNAFPLPNPGSPEILQACTPGPSDPSCPASGMKPSGTAKFNASYSNPASLDAYSIRLDHKFTNKINLFARYNYSPSNEFVRGFSTAISDIRSVVGTTESITAGATSLISPTMTNDFRFNYTRSGGHTGFELDNFGGAVPLSLATLRDSNVLPSPFTLQSSLFVFQALESTNGFISAGNTQKNTQHQINVIDSVSLQRGSHNTKFGFDFRRLSPSFDPQLYEQRDVFRDMLSAAAGNLQESVLSASQAVTILFHNFGAFAQDTWMIRPRLTLTYGLRWDVDFSPTTANGPDLASVTGFNLNDFSNLALAPAGTRLFHTPYGNVAPRLGAAYQISQSQGWQTVLRGGFGIFYDLATQEIGDTLLAHNYPIGAAVNPASSTFPLPAGQAGPPVISVDNLASQVFFATDPHLRAPYTLQWNVALEQGLGTQQSLTASYVGSAGRRLLQGELIFPPTPIFAEAVDATSNGGTSSYNALQMQFQRRLSNGLQALASYTWSHSIDTGSFGALTDGNLTNLNSLRASSDFDVRNAFSGAITYDFPAPRSNAFVHALLRGWSTDNIVLVQSAPPVDVIDPNFEQLLTVNSLVNVRPDVVPGEPIYLRGAQCASAFQALGVLTPGQGCPGGRGINPLAFTDPPVDPNTGLPTRQGNLGRNALRGFGYAQWDFAVHREFPIHESLRLQFRAELFNVLNHPSFGPPDSFLFDPFFGLATQTLAQSSGSAPGGANLNSLYQIGGPRSIQFALKLLF
jgi:Carboxypeptidase regulatory-like domain